MTAVAHSWIVAIGLIVGCLGQPDLPTLKDSDDDRLLIYPNDVSLSLQEANDGGVATAEVTAVGIREDGRPAETAHLNVYVGTCDNAEMPVPLRASLISLVASDDCTQQNSGFLQCILTVNGTATFTIQVAGVEHGDTTICVESVVSDASERVSTEAAIHVLAALPDEADVSARGLPERIGIISSFPVDAPYLQCGSNAARSCDSLRREADFDVVIARGGGNVAIAPHIPLAASIGATARNGAPGNVGVGVGTCISPVASVELPIDPETGATDSLKLCLDGRGGPLDLELQATADDPAADISLDSSITVDVVAQPARLTWGVTSAQNDDGTIAYDLSFRLEDCLGNHLEPPVLAFSGVVSGQDLTFGERQTEMSMTSIRAVAPNGESRLLEARLGATGERCLVVLRSDF